MTKSRYDINLFHKFDHLMTSFFTYNGGTYATQTGLITKKEELSRFSSIKIIDIWSNTLVFTLVY